MNHVASGIKFDEFLVILMVNTVYQIDFWARSLISLSLVAQYDQ